MLKIGVVTTTRADYGLLYPFIKKAVYDSYFDVEIIATGTHLSEIDGNTITFIEQDGFTVAHKIDILEYCVKDDSPANTCHTISVGLQKFSDLFGDNHFDALVVLGDRYELFAICIPAFINRIPIIHFYGGEVTSGAIDESIRHSITKLSSVHFTTTELHRRRVMLMGENEKLVFNVGALGVDNIVNMTFTPKEELYKRFDIKTDKPIAMVTYHPVTLEDDSLTESHFIQVMESLVNFDLFYIITMPNADHGSKSIFTEILKYAEKYPDKIGFHKSLGQQNYLSFLKISKIMIGNSSSGILESPSFRLPCVNIGERQKGRYRSDNIIDCPCNKSEIEAAIKKGLSDTFAESIKNLESPFGNGTASEQIIAVLKTIDFQDKEKLIKKDFNIYA